MRDRLVVVDLARTLALAGMVVFHVTFDLELFGWLAQGTTVQGGWAILARVVAGSFLFLAGVSLVLAHGGGLRWPAFRRRLVRVAGAAGVVTAVTWVTIPQAFIFFGILHSIALASVIGVVLLRLPSGVLLGLVVAVVWVDRTYAFEVLNPRWLVWTGLGSAQPWTMDFVPVFPWLAAFLAGMGVARLMAGTGMWDRLRGVGAGLDRLAWPGRHSLAIYLLHQPVLIALVWAGTQVLR